MFLLGVYAEQYSGQSTLVTIEKTFKNVRHQYTVRNVEQIPAAACCGSIINFYRDSRFIIRKRVFSQDKRPKKDVNAHPMIVAAVTSNQRRLVDKVRKNDIPLEALCLSDGKNETNPSEPIRPGRGRDMNVSLDMLLETVLMVARQQRLTIEAETAAADLLRQELEKITAGEQILYHSGRRQENTGTKAPLLPALAAPLWYRENVRYRQVYRTSSTCARRFK